MDKLHVEMKGPQTVFVLLARFLGLFQGVFDSKVGFVPLLPGGFGVVGIGQGLLGANGGDQAIRGFFVFALKFIQIASFHRLRMVEHAIGRVNCFTGRFNEN